MSKIRLNDYSIIFISYDEPNANGNFEDLKSMIHWAYHVKGVKGFAAAHREAAKFANTDNVVTVDGDTIIHNHVLDAEIDIGDTDLSNTVCCWSSTNAINGLQYANGGVKLWPREVLLNLDTHEYAKKDNVTAQIDYTGGRFTHKEMPPMYKFDHVKFTHATTFINCNPLQAWRAGFREGVKLGLFNGKVVENTKRIWAGLHNILGIWMTVGMDVENGIWAIYGARLGCYLTYFKNWDVTQINDLDFLNEYFYKNVAHLTEEQAYAECLQLGKFIETKFKLADPLNPSQSKFFKSFAPDPETMTHNEIQGYVKATKENNV